MKVETCKKSFFCNMVSCRHYIPFLIQASPAFIALQCVTPVGPFGNKTENGVFQTQVRILEAADRF